MFNCYTRTTYTYEHFGGGGVLYVEYQKKKTMAQAKMLMNKQKYREEEATEQNVEDEINGKW
jgi:hypothetical protein